MAIIAKADCEKSFEPITEGVHTCICYGIVDIGDQYSEQFKKKSRKIQLLWELPDETYTDKDGHEKPRFLSKEYTLSLGEKSNLRKDLQAWRGKAFTEDELKGFDVKNILGKGCQIQIIHKESNGAKRANIAAIMALPKGMKIDTVINDIIYFDLDSGEPIENIDQMLTTLPEWLQKKIKESDTYIGLQYKTPDGQNGNDSDIIGEDEIPFN